MGTRKTSTTLPENPSLSGLWGTVWLVTAIAAVLIAVVHQSPIRLLAYGFVEVTVGLVLLAALALWKGLDPGAAARVLARNTVTFLRCCRRNAAERQGVGETMRYGAAAALALTVLIWGIVGS